ncbi:MAG TPA: M24 family metallopeptidase [Longimicrobiales bacterium]|nr:M24 family metallopeptidase [Longimicrobiales bacterium]
MNRSMKSIAALFVLLSTAPAASLSGQERPFATLREQADIRQEWLALRLERVLPRIMREQGVEMWIVPVREYNEDPVFHSLVSPTTFAARRRTIYIFHDRGMRDGVDQGVERLAIGGTSQGGLYTVVRDPDAAIGTAGTTRRAAEPFGPEQWKLLTPLVVERDPQTIAVNVSHTHAFSDGLTLGEWEQMERALGATYAARVVRRELLPLHYIEERLPEMLPAYVRMQELVHDIIATAFSNRVIVPGETTTQDVVWWLRQRVNDLGLGSWFQPSVSVQRRGVEMGDSADPVIMRGDVLHTDFGIIAYGLKTDTQHMGYVLREGEAAPPAGLSAALGRSNRLQDILLEEMEPGRTGNDVLNRTLTRMRADGIDGTVYTHPIGDHGHGAGPTIGLWDRQDGVPGRGDVALRPNTWFSIELQATTPVAEWDGQPVRMAQEEDAIIDADGARRWVLRRQAEFHIVR